MYRKLALFVLSTLFLMPFAQAEEEFLLPSQAFVLSAEAVDHDSVKVNWKIAEGYYLYQSKLRFTTEQKDIVLGEAELPKATLQEDPIFGQVMTYRGQLSIDLPISQRPSEAID
jgi:thiol:disulfide interchange protein DsbD